MANISFDDLLRSGDPADSCSRRKDFGERVHTHHTAVDVHTKKGRNESFDKFLVGSWGRDVRGVGARVWLHLEEVVWLIFKNVDIVFLTTSIELPAPLYALSGACGVLAAWNSVQKERFLGPSGLFVPVRQDAIQT